MKTNLQQAFLSQQVGHCSRLAHAVVRPFYAKSMVSLDLKPSEFATLSLIQENPGASQGQVAEAIFVNAQNMANLIEKIESRGLIRREASGEDKRSYSLFLTDAGQALIEQALPKVQLLENQATAMLSEAEKQQLLSLLNKMIAQS